MLVKDIQPDAQSMNLGNEFFFGGSGTRDVLPKNKDVLKMIVDEPCFEACAYLFDCNIRTMNSSANCRDLLTGEASITIDYHSLSEENKKVAKFLIEKGIIKVYNLENFDENARDNGINIIVPIDDTTTSEELSERFQKIASFFKEQEILYGHCSEEEMEDIAIENSSNCVSKEVECWFEQLVEKIEAGLINDELSEDGSRTIEFSNGQKISLGTFTRDFAVNLLNYYYDEKSKTYWVCKELYDKAHPEQQRNSNTDMEQDDLLEII